MPERSVSTTCGRTAAPAADRHRARAQRAEQAGARGIVGVHDRHRIRLPARREVLEEEPRLGGEVALDIAVEIEVIARQVGEHRGVEAGAGDALLVERVRGDLDRHVRGPTGAHAREEPLQRDRVGRRERRGLGRVGVAIGDRPDDARPEPGRPPDLLQQIRRRRLPVGPGDADDGERRGRIAREPRRSPSEERTRGAGRHDDRRRRVDDVLGHDRDGAALYGVRRVPAPVLPRPGEREEHVARPDAPRVDGDARHLDVTDTDGRRGQGNQIA
jgi:hypothetical protein